MHVALVIDGFPVAGAVALPALHEVWSTAGAASQDRPPAAARPRTGPPRLAVSRTRPGPAAALVEQALGAEPVPLGSAGVKALAVVRGAAEIYAHSGGQYEWDSAAPVAVALAYGLHASRLDGAPLTYNNPDPYLPDLLIAHPDWARAGLLDAREAAPMLKNKRLLMTGLTGQLAGSIAAVLAPHNEIYGLARYSKPGSREAVEALGITPIICDYTSGDFTGVPNDFDYVFHAAADVFPADIETGIKQNAEGTGLLLNHLNRARAWIYVSTSGVYWDHPDPWYAYQETDRCGGSTRINTRFAYGTSKFAGEAVARSLSRIHGVPLTIARMNWSYGRASFGGAPTRIITRVAQGEPVPVHPDWEMVGCPIHEDDMAEHLEPFFDGRRGRRHGHQLGRRRRDLGRAVRPVGGRTARHLLLVHRR